MSGDRHRGMMYLLAAIAAIQIVVGSTVFFRTDAQLVALKVQYQDALAAFKGARGAKLLGSDGEEGARVLTLHPEEHGRALAVLGHV